MKKLILSIILLNLLSACAYFQPKKNTAKSDAEPAVSAPVPAAENAVVGNANAADVNAQDLAKADSAAQANTNDTNKTESNDAAALPKRSVYFPFDVDAIQDSDKVVIQAHGAYLSEHPEISARTEGNADERGSSEYNLALGQRRANNTKKALVLSGAKASQIEAISYGEEKPQATGHDEESWAQNRRADISYK